ncbi:50S ribosomal protein L31 [Phototrophicus methaneseepsis]|uniref:Large ribosomal subunit protein bL31 n=1 Tax=Phototrophicus methaneseepsis TaxID=2710758 RepID=A0A7S8ID32_9CHLR|nr:50S ribosomal protein L31 [Phototrophicus methaneseepsis]QPC81147.1 50S ribosomal protein L31 [Phototrophicus methaneseepsis]
MKKEIHPEWYPDAVVTCVSCGTEWRTGATVPTMQTEICANCHPFYTGQQRIVDTEGRVDTFMKRLRMRDEIQNRLDEERQALTPPDLPLSELGLSKRHLNILNENDINVVQDVLDRLASDGDDAILSISGIGRQALSDIKKSLRARGYELPVQEDSEEVAE